MMDPGDIRDELESLLLDWEDGTLDERGVERVRQILRDHAGARTHYFQLQMMSAALRFDLNAGLLPVSGARGAVSPSTRESTTPPSQPGRRVVRIAPWMIGIAGMLIVLLAGRLIQLELSGRSRNFEDSVAGNSGAGNTVAEPGGRDRPPEETAHGVAVVTRLIDVAWGTGQPQFEVGDALPPGRLNLATGFMQIEFFCGATVILEGPATIDLHSPLTARVRRGRLRAQVPPAARGFSLEVDDMTLVDLGTEFGLSVSDQGANIQVFDGEVELHPQGGLPRRLTAGNALLRDADGSFSKTDVTPGGFLDLASLEVRAAGQRNNRYLQWKQWSDQVRRDDRVIAYYAFDQTGDWLRRLSSSVEPPNRELDGAIVGAHHVPGRWSAKGGLEFKRPGDRVRVQIPGEFSSLTFACWVRIDSLDRWYNSLFLTDHYNQGEPHWQILDTGQLFFSVRYKADNAEGPAARKRTHHEVVSPPFWKPSLSGRWLHLATTYDANIGRTTHYLNGDVLHVEDIDSKLLVRTTRIGAASIGNWSIPTRPDAEFAVRNLNGSIDEFVIFAAALSAEEIREMYDHGKP